MPAEFCNCVATHNIITCVVIDRGAYYIAFNLQVMRTSAREFRNRGYLEGGGLQRTAVGEGQRPGLLGVEGVHGIQVQGGLLLRLQLHA